MVKKIGNIIFLFFYSFFFNLSANNNYKIVLKAFDANYNELKVAAVGKPFILEMSIEGQTDINSNPVIENLDKYLLSNKGVRSTFSNINGTNQISKTFNYEVRIDNVGKFQFGPIKIANKIYNVILNINVQQEERIKQNNSGSKKIDFKISVNKNEVYINEPTQLKIKFSTNESNLNLIDFELPLMKEIVVDKEKTFLQREEKINDQNYNINETTITIYPTKAGQILIPSIKAIYEIPLSRKAVFSFFGPQLETRETSSNSITLNVLPLPQVKEKINGVGIFKNFRASLNQRKAMQFEGIVFKIEIEGKANLDLVQFDQLKLPKNIKYYESKNYIEESKDGFKKKIFELIIQCSDIGKILIPEQEFVYFNPETKKIKVLKTKSIEFEITPLESQKIEKSSSSPNTDKEEIKNIYNEFGTTKALEINKYLFLLVLVLPIMFNVLNYSRSFLIFNKKNSYNIAIKKLKNAKKNNNSEIVYNIFIQYFIDKFNLVYEPIITNEFIKNKLKDAGLSKLLIDEWDLFFSNLSELKFFKKNKFEENIFEQAKYWLDIFEKSL